VRAAVGRSRKRPPAANVAGEALASVNTVTMSATTQALAAGSRQQRVATLRDANSNALAHRPITWALCVVQTA
jgi:hypothetical protein